IMAWIREGRKVPAFYRLRMNICDDTMTLNEWFEEWIATYKSNCVNTTILTYKLAYQRVENVLGDIPLSKLNMSTIQRAINKIESPQSQKDTLKILRCSLDKAVKVELLIKILLVEL
ncbi:MAG: phage integrase SAM-like domain-containing protein, partial [Lachnospiraceae bacterium]